MTSRKPVRGSEAKRESIVYQCRHCAHSYDWHSRALDGSLILCRCPFKNQGGKFCIFLKDPACKEHFTLRQDHAQTREQRP